MELNLRETYNGKDWDFKARIDWTNNNDPSQPRRWVLQDFKVDAKEPPKPSKGGGNNKKPFRESGGNGGDRADSGDVFDPNKPLRKVSKEDITPEFLEEVKRRKNEKVWLGELTNPQIIEHLGFDPKYPVKITFNGDALKHVEKNHGLNSIHHKQNKQPPIELEDIRDYPQVVNAPDVSRVIDNKDGQKLLASAKQINGYFMVIETISTKQNELKLKTLYKENGEWRKNSIFSGMGERPQGGKDSLSPKPSVNLDARPQTAKGNNTTPTLKKQTTAQGKNYLKSLSPEELKKAEDETYQELSLLATKPLSTTPLTKEQLFKELKGYKHFGHDFTEFRDKGLEALELIAKKKHGQVSGAYYRADLGAIDIGYQLPLSNNTQRGLVDLLAGRGASDTQTNIYYWGKPALAPFAGNTDKEKILRAVDKIIKEGTYSLEEGHHMLNLELDNGIYQLELFPLSLKQPSHFYPMSIQYHHKPKNPNSPMERE